MLARFGLLLLAAVCAYAATAEDLEDADIPACFVPSASPIDCIEISERPDKKLNDTNLPKKFDWRNVKGKNYVTDVQYETCMCSSQHEGISMFRSTAVLAGRLLRCPPSQIASKSVGRPRGQTLFSPLKVDQPSSILICPSGDQLRWVFC